MASEIRNWHLIYMGCPCLYRRGESVQVGVRCAGSMVRRFKSSMVQWFNGSKVQKFKGSMVQWFNGSMVNPFALSVSLCIRAFVAKHPHQSLVILRAFEPSWRNIRFNPSWRKKINHSAWQTNLSHTYCRHSFTSFPKIIISRNKLICKQCKQNRFFCIRVNI